jgi:hypothetical protein
MALEQQTLSNWIVPNVRDAVGASAEQVKETTKASLGASRAVMEVYREAASILRDRGDEAFRTGMAVMEAGFDENFEQLNRIAETKNLQDLIRLQMMWSANQTLAVCKALKKAHGIHAEAGPAPDKATDA